MNSPLFGKNKNTTIFKKYIKVGETVRNMKKRSFKELVRENKKALLKDEDALERLEDRLEKRLERRMGS
jgi:chaperonin cofactor prefoldin